MRQGSYVALITPMSETGAIDFPTLRSLLQFHLESGTDGLCILGTTGEGKSTVSSMLFKYYIFDMNMLTILILIIV